MVSSLALAQFKSTTTPATLLVIASNASLPAEEAGGQNYICLEAFLLVTLHKNTSPIRCPSRFRSEEDQEFIRDEVEKLAEAGVIENSYSSCRAQVVSLKTADHKNANVIRYLYNGESILCCRRPPYPGHLAVVVENEPLELVLLHRPEEHLPSASPTGGREISTRV